MTVREASEILVIEDGQIADRGSHADLLERDGAYARLHELQGADAATRTVAP